MVVNYNFICVLLFYFWFVINETTSKQCPDIKILNPYKSRSWIVEGIQIHNSTIRLLRGGSQPGTSQPINNIMVWDMTTNQMLKIFDIDIQISKMLYCKYKRKLLVLGTHKILEIHPLNFNIIDEYNIGGTHIEDVEDSDGLLLISRDQGNPFLYDIYKRQIVETLPYQYLDIYGEMWAKIVTLKDYKLFVNAKLIIFNRINNKIITYLGASVPKPAIVSRVCSFKKANFLVTGNLTNIIQLGSIYNDSLGQAQYQSHGFYTEVYYPTSSPVPIKFQDLYCVTKGEDYYIIGLISRDDNDSTIYKGATVLKINIDTDPQTLQQSFSFKVQEQWKYRRWRKDMEFFLFDEATLRGHSISEYEHYSYEFLESDEAQCDFEGDGVIDSYCRMAKTICHWVWNLNIGAYFLGPNSDYFFYANDNQKGYQIRDWNSTEILRFQLPRLIDKKQFTMRRVLQYSKSTYKLPFDTYILKMCWNFNFYSEMMAGHQTNAGFYIYQHETMDTRTTDTYNVISYMNPSLNPEKYLNPYDIIVAFTYNNELHVCVYYTVLEITINNNGDTVDNQASYQYFSNHNKECYKVRNGQVLAFYQLKLPTPFEYGKGLNQYSKCVPYFDGGFLICRNLKPMLEFWSLQDYSLAKTVDTPGCNGNYDIAVHRSRFYIGCEGSIIIYDTINNKITPFIQFDNKILLFVVVVEDILAAVFSTMEIMVYDLRPLDGSSILVLHYYDPQDCCLINSIDIHPVTKKLMWASIIQLNYIDLSPCLENPNNCLNCEINAYFKYDPNFSLLKQKYERNSWPIAQPQLYVNPKFLDSGIGTIERPYMMDMNIIQLYFKTHLYKQNIVNFQKITLNIYIDTSREQFMSNFLLDWVHDSTEIKFIPWDGSLTPTVSNKLIKLVINSSKFSKLSINNWGQIDMTNIQIVCPDCISNSLSFSNSGEVYLRNFISSLNLVDLIEPIQGQIDTRVFPNIKINVDNVNKFVLENQKIQNAISEDLNKVSFFTFNKCNQVIMKNIVFSNIVNQESIFESTESSIILDTILFTKINTCIDTPTKRTKFNIIPFQKLVASNIQFVDNQLCDMCLFQNIVSENNSNQQLISISNVDVINNKFDKYQNSRVLFFKMSLVSLISSDQQIEIKNVNFKNNKGEISLGNTYYFEIIKVSSLLLSQISIVDENLVGIGNFNKISIITMSSVNFINSQFQPESLVKEADRKRLSFNQNLILLQDVDSISLISSQIIGLETNGIVTIQIEESSSVFIQDMQMNHCSFYDSLFISISNLSNEIKNIQVLDSTLSNNLISTEKSHIQVGLLWIRAERSLTKIKVYNSSFYNNQLSVNQNTQKKSSLSITIENSISDLTIKDCNFNNYYPMSAIGDLFLNVQTFLIEGSTFQQNLTNLINSVNLSDTDPLFFPQLFSIFERINIKGAFIQAQAQTITMNKCEFQNGISSEGAVQMFPNNNFLQINLDQCTFRNLYASQTGTAFYVSSITSPANIKITNSHFSNLWLGNIQKLQKAHLYFESSQTNQNDITISNLDVYNIGYVQQNNTNPIATQLIYQESFILNLSNSKIEQSKRLRSLEENFYLKQKIKPRYQKQQNERLLLSSFSDLSSLMQNQIFYGSSLIQSLKGKVILQDLEINGNALINDKYINVQFNLQQPNILAADSSLVEINNLSIQNLNVNIYGGVILIQNSIGNTLKNLTLQNLQLQKQQVEQLGVTELYQEISQPLAFIICLQSDCTLQTLTASCDVSGVNRCLGRLIYSREGTFILSNSKISSFQLQNQNGTAIFIVNPKQKLNIENTRFENLYTSNCGGALYIYQNNNKIQLATSITDNIFSKNFAENYGGAISIESTFDQSQDKMNISSNQFIENSANISGAIYFSSYYFDPIQLKTNQFKNNKAQMGSDVYSKPSGFQVRLISDNQPDILLQSDNNDFTLTHGSGLQLPRIEADLFYIDSQGNQLSVDASLLPSQKEILEISISFDKKTPIKFSDSKGASQEFYISGNLFSSYDQDSKKVYFSNIELFGKEGSEIYLIITSSMIKKKQFLDKDGNLSYEPYRFVISIKFRGCSNYEIVTQHQISALSSNIKKCQICPDLSYSKNSEVCEQCPVGASCKANQEMTILPGYWRASQDTYTILSCHQGSGSCIGGQAVENQLCETGYIGPFCSECDLFNLRGDGQYSHFGKTLCKPCTFNFLAVVMLLGTFYVSIYLTVRAIKSNSNFIKAKILVKFMKTIKFKRIREVEQLQSQNILIKLLMTYFQLVSIIRTVNINIPKFLPEMSFYLGNPATNATTNINCIMPESLFNIQYIYYSFFLSLIIPFLHFFIFALTLKFQSLLNKEIMSINDLKAGIIFFFTYFQPEFIYQAIQLITCKTIDKKSYNQANISIECNLEAPYLVILAFIIILLSFLIPWMLYAKLTALNKNEQFKNSAFQLQNCQYAFLCINYKKETYYWEFIRMGERLLFILIASIFNSNQVLKILLLVFISEGYTFLLKKKKPFKNEQFNNLEISSNHVISASFLLAVGMYSENDGETVDIIFYIIFLIINWVLIVYIGILVMQEIINKITDRMIVFIEKNNSVRYIFERFLYCLKYLPFFRLNFDLKLYLNKKKKPLLYEKVRDIFLQLLRLPQEDRNIFFLSIKEHRNQSKFISKMMSQFKTQYQINKSSLMNQQQTSPQENLQKKLESVSISLSQGNVSIINAKQAYDQSPIDNQQIFRKSLFQSFNQLNKDNFMSTDKIKEDIISSNGSQKESMSILSLDQEINENTQNRNQIFGGISDIIELKAKGQTLYQYPVDSIKRLTPGQPSPLLKNHDQQQYKYPNDEQGLINDLPSPQQKNLDQSSFQLPSESLKMFIISQPSPLLKKFDSSFSQILKNNRTLSNSNGLLKMNNYLDATNDDQNNENINSKSSQQ